MGKVPEARRSWGGLCRVEGSQGAWAAASKGDRKGDGVEEQVGSLGAGAGM